MKQARTPPAKRLSSVALLLVILSVPAQALAHSGPLGYVGPGAGLSMLGALLAVAAVILLGLLAPILYPLRLLRKWRRWRQDGRRGEQGASASADASPAEPDAGRSRRVGTDKSALPDSHPVSHE